MRPKAMRPEAILLEAMRPDAMRPEAMRPEAMRPEAIKKELTRFNMNNDIRILITNWNLTNNNYVAVKISQTRFARSKKDRIGRLTVIHLRYEIKKRMFSTFPLLLDIVLMDRGTYTCQDIAVNAKYLKSLYSLS